MFLCVCGIYDDDGKIMSTLKVTDENVALSYGSGRTGIAVAVPNGTISVNVIA